MDKSLLLVLILTVALLAARCHAGAESFGSEISWMGAVTGSGDFGLIGEEFEMDTEVNRRILATQRYISYAALNKNAVPCSRRGASYYNCRPGASSNPYRRGCSAITRCRS